MAGKRSMRERECLLLCLFGEFTANQGISPEDSYFHSPESRFLSAYYELKGQEGAYVYSI